tara:strand:- start:962 stop:1150 length:189 start_codon:yes stop_codon:yes gene_type:complete
MRYSYEVKPVEGETKTLEAMSYKKFLRKLSTEFKVGETVQVRYKNKKGHDLVKYVKIKAVKD